MKSLGNFLPFNAEFEIKGSVEKNVNGFSFNSKNCLLYTSDAADERSSVDLGGRRIIKKKNNEKMNRGRYQ